MISKDKIRCTDCGKERKLNDFYASNSPFHKSTGKLHICKYCFWDFVSDDINKLKNALRMIDKPFLIDLLKSSQDEAERTNKNVIKLYMKNLGMNQNIDKTWADSDNDTHIQISNTEMDEEISDFQYEIHEETIRYWGKGYSDWEYEFLEEQKLNLMSSFECPDYGMEMIMKDICFINLDIEKLRQEKNHSNQKTITTLIETRSKLMNSANMNPIQATGAEGNDQVTFGTLIKKWENERPVPQPLEDEMKEYIDTFMIGHLAKMEGLNNELTEKYDKALAQHTINFNDINREQDDIED